MADRTREEKLAFVEGRLKSDPQACDFQVSLFRAAQDSYRYDTVLRPFPSMYDGATPEDRNYKALEKVTNKLQGLTEHQGNLGNADSQLLDLLYWIFTPKNFTLSTCKKDKYDVIKALTGQIVDTPAPTHIFELVPSASADERFQTKRGGRDTIYAYHGSRVENFHSIMNFGLQSHMNKNALFGEGTYLSSELSVSMPYAPTGTSWEKSRIGDKMSIIAVCEIIDDDSVKCQVKDAENGNSKRSRIKNSLGGEVPEKYYVVQNNDMMRVKYLVIFAESSRPRRASQPSWAYKNRFALMMVVYVLLLAVIGLYNSRSFNNYMRKVFR